MARQIRYSVRASEEQEKLYEYLLVKFGEITVIETDQVIEKIKKQLTNMPFLGKTVKRKNWRLRYVIVKKKLKIYYRINKEYIEIASFRDVRMNPKTLNLKF
ncbi:MAG TPA: hypothetical protein DDX39_05755 [Bacteroidales bacterium]|nr:MAG: hypothetical protein A2W98_07025 [Bacteroidetes bacterium GWF2_33_38]OFY68592.1 MAG: hypothetical protein A2265_02695 [Bacteroidetes bacterium RIFOXYA12_FULL_33_9]OFY91971.1 MAG: hypothetical protein A2236_13595 [Bacteroidetes bacterium RIFOXYA2_FULL_33_7]HBF88129.1 hypothetical protein [Bacteroidales bacterium]